MFNRITTSGLRNSLFFLFRKIFKSGYQFLVGLPCRKINDMYFLHNIRQAGMRGVNFILGLLMILFLYPLSSFATPADSLSPGISKNWLKDIWEKNRKESIEDEGDAFQTNTLVGEMTSNFFGNSVTSAGDINHDGFDDVIAGAYGHNSYRGKAYIFLGGLTMDNSPDIILTGENDSDKFGISVSTAGDVNGDGYDDVIVGASGHNSLAGKVYIFLGGSSMNSAPDVVINGEAAGNEFGVSVASAGDINGDGFTDVIAGAGNYNSGTGRSYIFFGSAIMNNSADLVLSGLSVNNLFGSSVSCAGDVNNDNYDDVIVGARGFSTNKGQAYIFLGGASPDNSYDVILTGEMDNGNFGNAVSFAGDVNADGFDDVVIGSNTHGSPFFNGGKAYVYLGGASMDSTADVKFNSPGHQWQLATTVTSAKDMNGDGFSDILIGAYGGGQALVFFGGVSMNTVYDVSLPDGFVVSAAGDINGDGYTDAVLGNPAFSSSTGRVHVYNYAFENQVSTDLSILGTPQANFGSGVHIGGDYNNDGYDDLLIGASGVFNARGRAFIFRGGYPFDVGTDVELSGLSNFSFYGNSVSSAGDVNGDGKDDVLVGAYRYNEPEGRAYLYFGEPGTFSNPNLTFNPLSPGLFGYSVSSAGDMNNDGYSDIVIGAVEENGFAGRVYVYFGGLAMNNVADLILNGEAAQDNLGHSVSSANVNNDAYDDIIIGAPGGNSGTGRVYIYLGSVTPDTIPDIVLNGTASGNNFGRTVSSAGNVNNDGFSDVIVSSMGLETVSIFHGGVAMDNIPDVTLSAESPGDNFGFSLSSAGDVNGDGFDDVIIGANAKNTFTGKAYIYLGGSSMDNTADVNMTGEGTYNYFGWSVAGGDLNDDGFSDVVVGAVSVESRGKAYIYLGSAISSGSVLVTGAADGNGTYSSLSQAFTEINNSDQTGSNIVLRIKNNTTEPTGGAILNAGTWSSLTIKPEGAITVSGAVTPGLPLIDLNGPDNVKIDGLNTGGNSLTISNTTVSSTSATSTIRLRGDATNNVITNCTILGSSKTSISSDGGNIFFGGNAVSTGNDNNKVSLCNIGPAGSNLPSKGIYFSGTTSSSALNNSSDTIRDCNIYDCFNDSVSSSGVYIGGGNTGIGIKNNKFYQTLSRTQITGSQHSGVWINNSSGNDFSISENTIGFASSTETGTYSITSTTGTRFHPVYVNCGTGTGTQILQNTIAGISLDGNPAGTLGSSPFLGIYVAGGYSAVTGNTIGSMSSNGSINIGINSAAQNDVMAIYKNGSGNFDCLNNNIGGLTVSNSGSGKIRIFVAFGLFGGTFNSTGNTIGGSIPNSISLNTTFTASELVGLRCEGVALSSVSSNILKNISNATGSSTGILFLTTSANNTVSQNTIYSLSSTNSSTWGMLILGSGGSNLFERNLIHSLSTFSNSGSIRGFSKGGLNSTYRNNMILLGINDSGNSINTGCQILAINEEGGTNNFYFNSVYVGGNPTSGTASTHAFHSTVLNNTRYFQNNIFYNTRSNNGSAGKHYAIKVAGTAPYPAGLTCNYNDLFANGTGGVLGQFNNNDQTSIASWRSATGQDSASINSNPKYISYTNLHIDSTIYSGVNNAATPIAGITDDYDGNIRNASTPDIGADEFNGIAGQVSLNLTMFIEGFYNSGSDSQVSDTLKVYLRNSNSPYTLVDSTTSVVSTNGTTALTFINAPTDTYYVVLTHRNSIETWSASGVSMTQGSIVSYDFSNTASQAYGNNMKQVDSSPLRFGIYSGDVNQDGIVDGSDAAVIDNDAYNFITGYVISDLNGDEVTDGSDAAIADNNAFNFVGKITP